MNALNPCGRPLCRPSPMPDEWSETYLFRLARANGIYRPRLSDIDRIRPTLATTASTKPDGYPVWGEATLPRWSVVTRVNSIRYCPQCMAESRYIRSCWRLTHLEVCTVHAIRLKDDLAEPVMTRGYRQPDKRFITEVTDEQLWAGALCPMPGERRHIERLWSGLEQLLIDGKAPEATEQLTCILFLEVLLDAIATAPDELGYHSAGIPRSTQIAELVERHQFLLTPNVGGIRNFLDQITGASHRNAVLARLRRMLIDEGRRQTCLSRLPIARLRRELLMSIRRDRTMPTCGPLHPSHNVPCGYVSLEEAASLIGCSVRLLKHLIHNEIRHGARIVLHGMKRYTYLPPWTVEACRRWYASLVTPRQLLNELHIERRGYAALLSMDLLRPVVVDTYTFFRRADFTGLCRRLEDVSRPFPVEYAHLHPLFGEWMSWSNGIKAASLEVVRDAFSGKLPIFRTLDGLGLSAYFVDQSAVERLRQLKRRELARYRQRECSANQLSLLAE